MNKKRLVLYALIAVFCAFVLWLSRDVKGATFTGKLKTDGVPIAGAFIDVFEDLVVTPTSSSIFRDTTDSEGIFTVEVPDSILFATLKYTNFDPYRYNEKYYQQVQTGLASDISTEKAVFDTVVVVDTLFVDFGEVDTLVVNHYFRSKGTTIVDSTLAARGVSCDSLYVNNRLIVPIYAGDPGDLVQGQLWYNSSAERLSYYDGAAIQRLQQVVE